MLRSLVKSALLAPRAGLVSGVRHVSEGTNIEKSLNQVTLLGRVGVDPQLKGTAAHPVVTLSLATNTVTRPGDGSEMRQRTEWHRISIFKPSLRDTVYTYVRKGSRILVNGKIMYGEIVDAKGITHQTTSIVADDVIFISTKSDESEQGVADAQQN